MLHLPDAQATSGSYQTRTGARYLFRTARRHAGHLEQPVRGANQSPGGPDGSLASAEARRDEPAADLRNRDVSDVARNGRLLAAGQKYV